MAAGGSGWTDEAIVAEAKRIRGLDPNDYKKVLNTEVQSENAVRKRSKELLMIFHPDLQRISPTMAAEIEKDGKGPVGELFRIPRMAYSSYEAEKRRMDEEMRRVFARQPTQPTESEQPTRPAEPPRHNAAAAGTAAGVPRAGPNNLRPRSDPHQHQSRTPEREHEHERGTRPSGSNDTPGGLLRSSDQV